jgi:hypothetical protein
MRKILFDIDRGNVNREISLDFNEISEYYSKILMNNFSAYFNRQLGIGCLRIFISDYYLKPNEYKLGIDPEKDKKDLKALGILIFRINININNWLKLSNLEKAGLVKDLWLKFFTLLPEIVYTIDKKELIKKFEELAR